MELTAKTLQEVTFGAKVRGYDPAEVDDFIAAVAEGVEELHERLRRATERATRAEQQLAAAPVDVPSAVSQAEPVSAAASSGNTEISKVWERAVAAAEEAVDEAKAEAQRLLDEARNRADTQLNDARREADTTVSTAKAEAARITEESQAHLRVEIQKLEAARDSLQGDVSGLSAFLQSEKERVKARLDEALAAIEQYGGGAAPLAEPASSSYVSDGAPVTTTTDDWSAPTSTTTSVTEPEWGVASTASDEPSSDVSEQDGAAQAGQSDDAQVDWAASQGQPSVDDWRDETILQPVVENESGEDASEESADDVDADGDPFLAELRRAVQDDGPLGPREDDAEDPLNDLHSSDDDGSNGFFRRNK